MSSVGSGDGIKITFFKKRREATKYIHVYVNNSNKRKAKSKRMNATKVK